MIILRVVFAIAIMLGGCSTQQKVIQSFDPAVLEAHVSTLTSIDSWKIQGRLGIRTDKGGQIGRMVWTRHDADHQIDLYGSLGSGHVRITVVPDEAVLVDSNGLILIAPTAQEVLDEYVGWHFPVTELSSWIIGIAHPDSSALTQWDELGRVISIQQAGWLVTLSKYQAFGDYQLPTRFRLVPSEKLPTEVAEDRPDQPKPSHVRLAINNWNLK